MDVQRIEDILRQADVKYVEQAAEQVRSAVKQFTDLRCDLAPFSFPDGKQKIAAQLAGTIPVPYKGHVYNIPVTITLWDVHPQYAPLCDVVPTDDMVIRPSPFVSVQGRIFLPYLNKWSYPHSDLLWLIQAIIDAFQIGMPLFAKTNNNAETTSEEDQSLREENERLRRELAELRGERSTRESAPVQSEITEPAYYRPGADNETLLGGSPVQDIDKPTCSIS